MVKIFESYAFVEDSKTNWGNVAPDAKRKATAYNPNVMQVKVAFEKAVIERFHKHYDTQTFYI